MGKILVGTGAATICFAFSADGKLLAMVKYADERLEKLKRGIR
jgi:hypothetical protein